MEKARTAIYVISRICGENADRKLIPGDYYLSLQEKADIHALNEMGIPVVLLLNCGGPVELEPVLDLPCLKAVMFLSQPGQEGGNAVADLLSGKMTPCGKLTSTWARRYSDYPFADEYIYLGDSGDKCYYREGIFVGYRYFDSFHVDALFSFGFGLSYTRFAVSTEKIYEKEGRVQAEATVSNTGTAFARRDTVQAYLSCPQTELIKEHRRLVGFAKTKLLAPGETDMGS